MATRGRLYGSVLLGESVGRGTNSGRTRARRAWVLGLVLLVHAILIAAVAGMRTVLHVQEAAAPSGVPVVLFRWPGFARPRVRREPSPTTPRTRRTAPQPPQPAQSPAPPALPAAAPSPSSTVAPIPAAPPATGQLPAGLGRIIAQHARCYGFQLTEEERARCAKRDLGRGETEAPLNIAPAKVRGWEADLQRRRAPAGPSIVPCPKETGGSNLGTGCLSHDTGVHVPLP